MFELFARNKKIIILEKKECMQINKYKIYSELYVYIYAKIYMIRRYLMQCPKKKNYINNHKNLFVFTFL